MGKRSMSEPNLDYLFAEPTRYRNSPLKRSPSGGQLSRGFHRFSPQSRTFSSVEKFNTSKSKSFVSNPS